MFSYLGSKSKLAALYPAPKYDLIIEPFAGSARYSLLHHENNVHLYDVSDYVVEVWKYLIEARVKDILALPDVPSKTSLDEHKSLSQAERWLIGFHLCRGKAKPRKTGHGQNGWDRDKLRIANNLYKIRHWRIQKASFETIPNRAATYFIDPPYKLTQERAGNSDRYPHGDLDYRKVAMYAESRRGQVIVCEGEGATYLPFKVLTEVNANTNNRVVKRTKELIYVQHGS